MLRAVLVGEKRRKDANTSESHLEYCPDRFYLALTGNQSRLPTLL